MKHAERLREQRDAIRRRGWPELADAMSSGADALDECERLREELRACAAVAAQPESWPAETRSASDLGALVRTTLDTLRTQLAGATAYQRHRPGDAGCTCPECAAAWGRDLDRVQRRLVEAEGLLRRVQGARALDAGGTLHFAICNFLVVPSAKTSKDTPPDLDPLDAPVTWRDLAALARADFAHLIRTRKK